MIDKKTKFISLIVLVLILVISGLFLLIKNNFKISNNDKIATSTEFSPEFLTTQEKEYFRIDPSIKAQVMSRGADGKIKVYRIIDNDSDIINPKDVSPIR